MPKILDGIRVVDFTMILAGSHTTQWLAVMGAEVIKIETNLRPDLARRVFAHGKPHTSFEEGIGFAGLNYSKKDILLNMNQPRARELVRELVKISDVVADNFGGPVMDNWGLGYEDLKKIKPDIIVYSGSGWGRTGPFKTLPAFAPIIDAFNSVDYLNGYPGGEPLILGSSGWTDLLQAQHAAFAILAAIYHRFQTGEGQYIDCAMTETNGNCLGEVIMDYILNKRITEKTGNRDKRMAPHGCYCCRGEDKWIAIAVSNEAEWQALCNVMGNPKWTKQPEFSDELSRWQSQDELDRLLNEWTKDCDHYELMDRLQKAGVMAGASLDSKELAEDPQLTARKFLLNMEHPVMGEIHVPRLPWLLSNVPEGNYEPAPLLGEHNNYVFGKLLGIPKEEIQRLIEEKVIY